MPTRDPDGRELDAVRSADPQAGDSPETALNRRVGAAARALADHDRALDTPPPSLWNRIAAGAADTAEPAGPDSGRLGRDDADIAGPDSAGPDELAVVRLDRDVAHTADEPADDRIDRGIAEIAGTPDIAEPDSLDRDVAAGTGAGVGTGPSRSRIGWLAAAAALLLVVAVGAFVVATSADDPTVVATARLEPLADAEPGTGATSAEVVDSGRGQQLDLGLSLPQASGFYEVWLIDPQVEGMVSLGPLRPDGRYAIPDDLDIADFPIVDVSIEPPDGVPTHSGISVLRGTLS